MGRELAQRARAANPSNGNNGEVEQRQPPTIGERIQKLERDFQLAMPRGMEATQLIRDALTALRTTRNLDRCDADSVLGGLMTCAQLGLRVGVLGHAWLLPFYDGRSKGYKAQLIIGYQGYRELAQRSGQIATLIGRVVHENDEFDIDYGLADNLIHKPALKGSRGEPVGYYSIVKYTSGGYAFWHMTKAEVEEHRDRYAMAKTKEGTIVGPWRDNFDEMAVKTAFLRLAKWMPKSTEMAYAIAADETVRVDLSTNNDSILHGQRPDYIDGDVDDDNVGGAADGDTPAATPSDRTVTEDDPERAAIQNQPAAPKASQAQKTAINTWFSDIKITDRDERLRVVSGLVGRPITSTNDLTKDEASMVIDKQKQMTADSDDPAKVAHIIGEKAQA